MKNQDYLNESVATTELKEKIQRLSREISVVLLKINVGVSDGEFPDKLLEAKDGLYQAQRIVNELIQDNEDGENINGLITGNGKDGTISVKNEENYMNIQQSELVHLAIGSEEDYYQFAVELNWLYQTCKTFSGLKFNTVEELEKIFKGNWDLSQKIYDLGQIQNKVIRL